MTCYIDPIFDSTFIVNEAEQDDFGYYWTSTSHLDGMTPGDSAVYVSFGRALGNFALGPNGPAIMDVHGAGAQRSDPKVGPNEFPDGRGPQGDLIRIYNMVRCVRGQSGPAANVPNQCM